MITKAGINVGYMKIEIFHRNFIIFNQDVTIGKNRVFLHRCFLKQKSIRFPGLKGLVFIQEVGQFMHFRELITFNRNSSTPIYLQVSDSFTDAIRKGKLAAGYKLPGTKKLAALLGLHTKTIEQVYNELDAQGWVFVKANSGTYISAAIPSTQGKKAIDQQRPYGNNAAFSYRKIKVELYSGNPRERNNQYDLILSDNQPDIHFMPAVELEKNYRSILNRKQPGNVLNKENAWGSFELRNSLVKFLNSTRGLNVSLPNVLISKGNQFSIFLILSLALKENDVIVYAELNYKGVYNVCKFLGLDAISIKLDNDGIVISELEKLCKTKRVKAVYVTPHIHYPTGVKLSLSRRTRLLELAEKFNFLIIEDDMDFDFHYTNSPSLPIASNDTQQRVVYIGGLNRLVSASLRISYITGPEDFLTELAKLKISIDKLSDTVMEEALAITLKSDILNRYRNKAVKHYQQKSILFTRLIDRYLSEYLSYTPPIGGMGVWLEFRPDIPVDTLVDQCKKAGLLLPERSQLYTYPAHSNGIKIGFASTDKSELAKAILIIQAVIQSMLKSK